MFRGTRVPVAALFESLEDGISLADFVELFPGVTQDKPARCWSMPPGVRLRL
jgi:uncharacterized protein (DUF433 family)